MLIRRGFLWWLIAAAVVLPIWLGVGWIAFGQGGWGTLGLVVTIPIAFITLGAIALLVRIRPTVRAERAASWMDVGIVGALHAAVIGIGFYGDTGAFFGFPGATGVPSPTAVRSSVTLEGPEPAERYETLVAAVDEHCPVLDLFTRPVPVERTVTMA